MHSVDVLEIKPYQRYFIADIRLDFIFVKATCGVSANFICMRNLSLMILNKVDIRPRGLDFILFG